MTLRQWWTREYEFPYSQSEINKEWLETQYGEAVKRLRDYVWVVNYPNDIPQMEGLATACAHLLGRNTWKCHAISEAEYLNR